MEESDLKEGFIEILHKSLNKEILSQDEYLCVACILNEECSFRFSAGVLSIISGKHVGMCYNDMLGVDGGSYKCNKKQVEAMKILLIKNGYLKWLEISA